MTQFAEIVLAAKSDQIRRAKGDLDGLTTAGGRAEKMTVGLTRALAGAAIAAAGAFGGAAVIREVSAFESSMSRVAAISRATDADLKALRATARQLGSSTEFSASQAADGLGFLAMAGFTAKEALDAIPSVLDLATAAGMELASAADIASNIMSGFGIEASNAASVADVLAAASSRANTDVSQLGQAMSTVAPISAALGIGLEDTAAAIGVMSDAGIQGERAGTALRGVLASLAGPTTQAQDALARYGLTVADVDPATHGLAQVMQTLGERGLSTADAMTVFGREAASGALVMIEAADRVADFGDELRNVDGAASDMASTMRDNLGGDIKGLQSAVSGLILAIGDAGLTAVIRGVVQAMTAFTQGIISTIGAVGNLFTRLREVVTPTSELEIATNNVVLAMADEIEQSQQLSIALGQTNAMSVEAARVKLEEAQGRYENVTAIIAEQRALALGSDAYARVSGEIEATADALRSISASPDTLLNSGRREQYEGLEQTLVRLRSEQSALLQTDQALSDQAKTTAENIATIEAALAGATNGLVSFGGELITPIELGDRLGVSVSTAAGALSTLEPAIEAADKAVNTMGHSVRNELTDAWQDFVDGGLKDFDGFARSIIKTFGRMLAQMILMGRNNPIQIGASMGIGGMGGGGGMLSALGNANGGLAGMANTALAGVGGMAGLGSAVMGGASFLGSGIASGFAAGGIGGAISGGASAFATAMSGATLGLGGAAAALGAAIPVIGAVALVFSAFKTKTKLLDSGVKVAVDGLDVMAESFRKVEKSKFFGLSKSRSTSSTANPELAAAVGDIQLSVMEAARVLGTGAAAFDGFSYDFQLSLKGLDEEQRMQAINAELMKLGDNFAMLVPGMESANEVLAKAAEISAKIRALMGFPGFQTLQDQIFATAVSGTLQQASTVNETEELPTRQDEKDTQGILERIIEAIRESGINNGRLTARLVALQERQELDPT